MWGEESARLALMVGLLYSCIKKLTGQRVETKLTPNLKNAKNGMTGLQAWTIRTSHFSKIGKLDISSGGGIEFKVVERSLRYLALA